MLELLEFLKANDWRVFVCSGGGRDFMRVFAEETWGIYKERVIGTAAAYTYADGKMVRSEQLLGSPDLGALLSGGSGSSRRLGVPGQGLVVLVLQPSPEVLDFQAALLAAVTRFTESGGTPAAFVIDPGGSISQSTMDSVDGYVPAQIGEGRYIAHVTVGFATLEDLKSIETEPFNAFDVHPASVAVYHLGDSGAARKRRKAWPLASLRRGDGRRAMAASRIVARLSDRVSVTLSIETPAAKNRQDPDGSQSSAADFSSRLNPAANSTKGTR